MKQPYTCICCGYETIYKTAMNTHFYNKKKYCPRIINNIELTDEIKQYILNNRIYKIPVVPVINNITNIINNYNTINNIFFIQNMNTIKEFKSVNFENKYKSLEYNNTDFINIINQINDICSGKQMEELNLINLCEDGDLEEMLVEKSIKKIIIILQKYLFDAYEFYLIKNIHTTTDDDTDESYEKTREIKELLQEYYKFIGCFGLNPAVKGKSDSYILEDEDNDIYELSDIYWSLYKSELYDLKAREIAAIKKDVIDIINQNTIRSIDEMSKKVVELFQVDENFFKN